jgi:hypothetical protein
MSEKKIFDFKSVPRLEYNKRKSRMARIAPDDALILPYRANPRGWDFRERQRTKSLKEASRTSRLSAARLRWYAHAPALLR